MAEAGESIAIPTQVTVTPCQNSSALVDAENDPTLSSDGGGDLHVMKQISPVEEIEETPSEKAKRLEIEAQTRAILNQQTVILYRQYAQEQHPKEPHKQEELIHQLQEQHFEQYITNVYQQQIIHQRNQLEQLAALKDSTENETETDKDVSLEPLPLIPASLWTRKDISEFKAEVLKTQKECCIKIGSLATATVRVPTHPEGSHIFWEFATDYYDLGFGIYFEWCAQPSDVITVHISESSDEGEDPVEGGASEKGGEGGDPESAATETGDLERGTPASRRRENRLPTDELIPVYRRDCHEEVYCGSHQYPGRGVYVLKFDNSYSLWRSKWLYYRVYYTQ